MGSNYRQDNRQNNLQNNIQNNLQNNTRNNRQNSTERAPQPGTKVLLAVIVLALLLLAAFLLRSCRGTADSSAPEAAEEAFDWEKAFQEAMTILETEDEEHYSEAVTLFKDTIGEKPDYVDAWRGLALIYLRMGETGLAEETLLQGYETTHDDALNSWAEQLAQENSQENSAGETAAAAEEAQPAPQEEEDDFDGHEPVTLTCTFIPFEANGDTQHSLLLEYTNAYHLVVEDSHGFTFSEPVEAVDPLTGRTATVTEAIAFFYKDGSYHAWEKDFNIEQGGTYTVTGFWCSPADLYGQGSWVDDKLFGPRGTNEAGDWYTLYTYGPFCFAVARVE